MDTLVIVVTVLCATVLVFYAVKTVRDYALQKQRIWAQNKLQCAREYTRRRVLEERAMMHGDTEYHDGAEPATVGESGFDVGQVMELLQNPAVKQILASLGQKFEQQK